MSEKEKWPKWIYIIYQEETNPEPKSYTGSAPNRTLLKEALMRTKINADQVIKFTVDEERLSREDIEKTFRSVEKYKKERDEIEKRKKAEEESKNKDKRSRTKS